MNRIIIAFGEPAKEDHWLCREFRNLGFECVAIGSKKKNIDYRKYGLCGWILIQISQFSVAYKCIKKSNKDDIIVSQDFGTGRLCSFLSTILCIPRCIIALNCLQRVQSGVKWKFEQFINKYAWRNKHFYTTVNSKQEYFKISVPHENLDRVYLLEDTFGYLYDVPIEELKYDCFTGGYANRDFKEYFRLAEDLNDLKFACVVGSNFNTDDYKIPANVTMFKDVSEEEFGRIMRRSKVVVMPLMKDIASGLVVLKDAIRNHKIVVSNNTEAIRNYIPEKYRETLLVVGGHNEFVRKLKNALIVSSEERDRIVKDLQKYNKRFSPENQVKKIVKIFTENGVL